MTRWRLVLEYDGTDFSGWQLQDGQRSVQGALEVGFEQILGRPVRLHAAGRTDAGVHAAGQVAHADAASPLSADELRKGLNAVLPGDVSIVELHPAPADFDARRDALGKRYAYRILNRYPPSPLRRRCTWHLRNPLNVERMAEAAACLIGTHDFAAFRGGTGGADREESTRRTLTRLDAERRGDEVLVAAEGRSFLRHMVRNLVGTLVEIGRGRRPPEQMAEILASADRARAGPTAPACGLCLEWVEYPPDRLRPG